MSAGTVKERPILFKGAMVRALLDGSKTQTRRIVKPNYQEMGERDDGSAWPWSEHPDTAADHWHACPYGQPGDRLWVRETYADAGCRLTYRADLDDGAHCMVKKWTPGIHMFRADSRILLEIVSVRVERLQAISEADSLAEGIQRRQVRPRDARLGGQGVYGTGDENDWAGTARQAYEHLWEQINGAGSWDANPWVWVVEFKRVTP